MSQENENKIPTMLEGSDIAPESSQEETVEATEQPEEKSALDKRFAQLTGEREWLRGKVQKTDEENQKLKKELESFKAARTEPELQHPGDNASPEEINQYWAKKMESTEQRMSWEIENRLAELRFQSMKNDTDDFAELHEKYWDRFQKSPTMMGVIESSNDPINEFYVQARRFEEIEKAGQNVVASQREAAIEAASSVAEATPPETVKKRQTGRMLSDDDWREYQRMFPNLKVTREEVEASLKKELV